MKWVTTPQGYKIATAKITRGGGFQYYGKDLGFLDERATQPFTIYRDIKDLSSNETLKSFEGLPLTMTHPSNAKVMADDWNGKAIGHIQNVRADGNYIVCDAYINDKKAIDFLTDYDLRELSVGYESNPKIVEADGKYYHKDIQANHIAIVVEGRAGSECKLLIDNKGKKMNLKDIIAMLKGKSLKDDATTLSADEINQMIESLEATLKELQTDGSDEAKAKEDDILAQLAQLKEQLAQLATPPNDADGDDDIEAIKTERDTLKAENEQLKTENADLKAQIAELKGANETETALNDAKAKFPKVNFADAKNARDVHSAVLFDGNIFTDKQIGAMTDAEVKSAYIAYQATKKLNIGRALLNDTKPSTKSASARLGGKS